MPGVPAKGSLANEFDECSWRLVMAAVEREVMGDAGVRSAWFSPGNGVHSEGKAR